VPMRPPVSRDEFFQNQAKRKAKTDDPPTPRSRSKSPPRPIILGKEPRKSCEYCHMKLRPIGDARPDGKGAKNDWASRKYHKVCYGRMMKEKAGNIMKHFAPE
jgi:hypothetical protein